MPANTSHQATAAAPPRNARDKAQRLGKAPGRPSQFFSPKNGWISDEKSQTIDQTSEQT